MQPTPDERALAARLRQRARVLEMIRAFFAARGVIEVDTPALSRAAVTDPALTSMSVEVAVLGARHYLQTSPEFAMKRLLAAGADDCYQIARVFRDGEIGRWHQPEFLLLEWYSKGVDEFSLMDEVYALLGVVLAERLPALARLNLSYREAFTAATGIDPLEGDAAVRRELERRLEQRAIDVPANLATDALLDLVLTTIVIPEWPRDTAVFLRDYPASQAALAAIKPGEPPVAARFEVFLNGLELGNGFRELTDAPEQRRRFENDLAIRRRAGLSEVPLDTEFLAALEHGLPECAGVAVGIDRLIAVLADAKSLAEVVTLPHGVRPPGQTLGSDPGV